MTDPIADFLTRIRNGYQARKKVVEVPYSKIKEGIGQILVKKGYLRKIEAEGKEPQEKRLVLALKYKGGEPAVTGIKRLSKPSVRIYAQTGKIPSPPWGFGVTILSTSQGLMTDREARKKKIGGEVICQIW